MIKTLLFLLLLGFAGCKVDSYYIDAEFEPYIEFFEEYYKVNVKMDIMFRSTEYPTIGLCYYGNRIEIDPNFWFSASDLHKEALLFHELGHCIFYRKHNDKMMKDVSCPLSLMNRYIMSEWCYKEYRDYYLKELKK